MNTEVKKLFVPYEISFKLKELDFSQECLANYDKESKVLIKGHIANKDTATFCGGVISPTYDQVIDWLEEKHQIFIEIGVDCTTYPKFCYSVNKFFGNPKDLTEKEWGWEHPKPENWCLYKSRKEATEEAIKFALTLI